MGNQRGRGLNLIFLSIFLIATKYMCLGVENTTNCSEQERLALLKFKGSVIDEFEMLSSWVGNDCCQWKGVQCDVATRSVVSLRLRGHIIWNSYYFPESNPSDKESSDTEDNYPVGEDYYVVGDVLDSSLAELRHLKCLDLSGNDFKGSQIPEFIGSLKHLGYLNLSNTGFQGIIPSHIGNLSNLEVLDLGSSNQDLMAENLAWVFGLSLLKHLDLSGVDLRRVQNLNTVLYIPSLINVSLSHCSLTNAHLGPRLNSSRSLPNIQYLDLSKNYFIGQLPAFLQNMTSLTFLDISKSYFSHTWHLASFLNMIPSLSELHLSDCGLVNQHLYTPRLNISTHSNIQYLDLSMNTFEGRFPFVFKNMSSLRVLDLRHNFLNSSVPVMPNLLKLDISSNKFTDIEHVGLWRQCHLKQLSVSQNFLGEKMVKTSTNISECSQHILEVLYLDHNQLNNLIPASLVRLGNLRVLDLSSNRLTNQIHESIGRLRMLELLDLSSNQLNGTIPNSIGQLDRINYLNLSSNYLEGTFSKAHFANLSMLKYLDISDNTKLEFRASPYLALPFQLRILRLGSCKILDPFPGWLQTQSELKILVLSNTGISGPLPIWFSNMPIIPHLDLSHNNLNGPLTNLPLGKTLNGFQDKYRGSLLLQNNSFSGSIPMSLCRRTFLEVLDLSRNRLTGKIPSCLQNLQKLRAMILSSNMLFGVIPSFIGRISSLSWLHLNDNNFTGEIPYDLGNLHHLWILDLGNNDLSGRIPEWTEELTELMIFRLHKNNFSGRIPSSLCKSPCLQILDVAHNNLNGSIPRCLGEIAGMVEGNRCRHIIYSDEKMIQVFNGVARIFSHIVGFLVNIDLSSNELVGQIPNELTKLSNLLSLNLSHNYLTGIIPDKIGNIKELESLDLSENRLIGLIPPSIAQMNMLSYLDLAHNNLSGRIPSSTLLQSVDPSSYADNEDLCGPPLPNDCTNHDTASTTSKNKNDANDEPNKVWFYMDIISGFATGFCGVIVVVFFKKQLRHNLYKFADVIMDKIHIVVAVIQVAVIVIVAKMKRQNEAA